MEGTTLSYIKLKFSPIISRKALIDTGACSNVFSQQLFDELCQDDFVASHMEVPKPEMKSVKMASGQTVAIDKQLKVSFRIAHRHFTEIFLVLPTTDSIISGNQFLRDHNTLMSPKNNILHFPDLSIQINKIKPMEGPRRTTSFKKVPVCSIKKQTIEPFQQIVLHCKLAKTTDNLQSFSGVITPNENLERELDIAITSFLSTVATDNSVYVSVFNITDHPITLPVKSEVAEFDVLTAAQAERLLPIDPNW